MTMNLVQAIVEEMRPTLTQAGIISRKIDILLREEVLIDVVAVYDQLVKIKRVELANFAKTWNLVPPQMWQYYKDHGVKNLREQLLLKEVKAELKAAWQQRVLAFVKKEKRDAAPVEESRERSA